MNSIVTVATMKGGSGKSTLASCLAVHWHLHGRNPVVIDADPQRSIARLAARQKALGGVPVVEDATADVAKTAQHFAHGSDPVIIDTPGFRSQATLACVGATDFVLVPVKPSPFDVDRVLDTLNILIHGVSGRRPEFRCVLTQTTRDSVIARHIRSELAEAGFPVPRHLCRSRALGRNPEPDRGDGTRRTRHCGDRLRGRWHSRVSARRCRMNKKKLPKAITTAARRVAPGRGGDGSV